jgi:hypothetical protein
MLPQSSPTAAAHHLPFLPFFDYVTGLAIPSEALLYVRGEPCHLFCHEILVPLLAPWHTAYYKKLPTSVLEFYGTPTTTSLS